MIRFGEGRIADLAELIPPGARLLMLYGGGSIFQNGVYAQVKAATAAFHRVEVGGIKPNPDVEDCREAIETMERESLDFVLAVGGGSVADAAKFIALAAKNRVAEPWQILTHETSVTEAFPVGVVLTLPATGSESNNNFVISNRALQEKRSGATLTVFPKFAVLDPSVTYTLPRRQLQNGVIDSYVHILEQYITQPVGALVQDRLAEGLLLGLREVGLANLDPKPAPEIRAALMWASTLALNKLIGAGARQDWSTHGIGHLLTAAYGLDHAESLAVVLPGVWAEMKAEKEAKLAQYGARVLGLHGADVAGQAIAVTEAWFRELGMKTRLGEYGIDAEAAASEVFERLTARELSLGEGGQVTPAKARAILLRRA